MIEKREAYFFTWTEFGMDELCGPYKNIDVATTSMKRWRNAHALDPRAGVTTLTAKQVEEWPKRPEVWPVIDDEPVINQEIGRPYA